jgi:hypothetical protein
MAVLKPREKLVYFRVSEDEFRQFVSVCEQAGARSVSDLARSAVQRLIAEGKRQRDGQELEERMQVLERMIAAVTEQLQLLSLEKKNREAAVAAVTSVATLPNGADQFFWRTATEDHNGRREE